MARLGIVNQINVDLNISRNGPHFHIYLSGNEVCCNNIIISDENPKNSTDIVFNIKAPPAEGFMFDGDPIKFKEGDLHFWWKYGKDWSHEKKSKINPGGSPTHKINFQHKGTKEFALRAVNSNGEVVIVDPKIENGSNRFHMFLLLFAPLLAFLPVFALGFAVHAMLN